MVHERVEPPQPELNSNGLPARTDSAATIIAYKTNNPVPRFAEKLIWVAMLGTLIYFICNIVARGEIARFTDLYSLTILSIPLVIATTFSLALRLIPQSTLTITPSGLTFSRAWALPLSNRLNRNWDDVHVIDSHSISGRQFVSFAFKSGGSAEVNLSHLGEEETETLLRAVEKWGNPVSFSAAFVNLQRTTILEQLNSSSYTQLWMDDLNRSYRATNFLPLPSNRRLQDGRYTIQMELAAGGMSAVYLGYDDKKAKIVIKETVVPPNSNSMQTKKYRELFQREARLLAAIDHPRICKVLDCFVEAERDYIILEFIAGLSLRQLVSKSGAQSEKVVLKWAKQITEILNYLHTQTPQIVHRDISPDNLILSEKGEIVLIDFGAANQLLSEATGTMIGKQCYMAPEQIRGKAVCQSDLYSLGATIYFLLTANDPLPLAQSKLTTKERISPTLQKLVADLTEPDSTKRPTSAAEVLAELAACAASARRQIAPTAAEADSQGC